MCVNFVMISVPFYLRSLSPYDAPTTLIWSGVIIAASPAVTVLFAPMWGALTGRFSPKWLYMRGVLGQAVALAMMAVVTDLPGFLVLRILQGSMAGISTIGIVMISGSSERERLASNMGLYQASQTIGQIAGPAAGAAAASLFGFRPAFIGAAAAMVLMLPLFYWFVDDLPPREQTRRSQGAGGLWLLSSWLLSFGCTIQIVFLPVLLPTLLLGFEVPPERQLLAAGLIVFSYGTASCLGSYAWGKVANRYGSRRVVLGCAACASLLQALLFLPHSVWLFGLVRVAQTGIVCGVFPSVMALVVRRASGATVGAMNAARFAGNAAGPLIASFVFARSGEMVLFLLIAGYTLGALAAFATSSLPSVSSAPELMEPG